MTRVNPVDWSAANTLVGFEEKYGTGYHFYATKDNVYPQGVPIEEIDRRLLNWTAVDTSLDYDWHEDGQPTFTRMTDVTRKILVASDTGELLGVHGSSRPTRQYRDALINRVQDLLDVPELHVTSVGFLDGRKKMWINIGLAETLEVEGTGIEIDPYLLAATSHDASIAWTFKMLTTLITCGNQVSMRLRSGGGGVHRVKATKYSDLDVSIARDKLGILHQNTEAFMSELKTLTETDFHDRQWSAFLDSLAPVPEKEGLAKTKAENKRDQLTDLYVNSPMVSPWRRTAFGAFQAANTWEHHFGIVRGGNRPEKVLGRAVTVGKNSVEDLDSSIMANLDKVLATVG